MKKLFLNSLFFLAALIWIAYVAYNFFPQASAPAVKELLRNLRTTLSQSGTDDVVLVAWLWVASYLAGRKLIHALGVECQSGAERCSVATGAGLVLVTACAFALATIHALHDLSAFILLLAPPLFCWRELKQLVNEVAARWREPLFATRLSLLSAVHAVLLAYTGTVLVIALISALGPEIEFDAVAYHLPAAKAMVQARSFQSLPDIPMTFFPRNLEILFALGMIWHSQITAKLIEYLFGVLTLVAVHGFSRRFLSRTAGLLATAILASSPLFVWEMRTAHIDCGFAFAVFLSFYATILWLTSGARPWSWLAMLFTAWSLGIRYQSLFSLGALGLLIFAYLWCHGSALKAVLVQSVRFCLISSAGLVPWGIVNLVQTGNPLFPLLNGLFRSPLWNAQQESIILAQQVGSGVPVRWSNWWAVATNFINLSLDRPDFHGNIGIFYLLLLPLLLLAGKIPRALRLVLGFSAVFWILWIFTGQHARYLLGILPGLAIAAAYPVARLLESAASARSRVAAAAAAGGFAILAMLQSPLAEQFGGYSHYGNRVGESLPWNLLIGRESRDKYLARYLPAYPVAQYLNRMPGKKRVLFWWTADVPPVFYLDGVSETTFSQLFPDLYTDDPLQLAKVLWKNGVTHVVVGQLHQEEQYVSDPERQFVQRYLKKLYQQNAVVLYEVSSVPLIQETVAYDFLDHIREASFHVPSVPVSQDSSGDANIGSRTALAIGGDTRYALLTRPPEEVTFHLTLPPSPVLRFSVGRLWPPCMNSGSFQIWVQDSVGIRRKLFDSEVSEPNPQNEAGWYDRELQLDAFRGQPVQITFQTTLSGGVTCDWFLWGDPQIVSRESDPAGFSTDPRK